MSRTTTSIILGTLLGAIALAGCGTISLGHHTAAARPPSCHQQYETWKQQATPSVKTLMADLQQVQTEGSNEDILKTTAALEQVGTDASSLATSHPLPHCADPAGYYAQFLAKITAAGDNARSASGLGGILLAEAPLQTVVAIENQLSAELNKTVGVKH